MASSSSSICVPVCSQDQCTCKQDSKNFHLIKCCPEPRLDAIITSHGPFLYLYGGYGNNKFTIECDKHQRECLHATTPYSVNKLWRFNTLTCTWRCLKIDEDDYDETREQISRCQRAACQYTSSSLSSEEYIIFEPSCNYFASCRTNENGDFSIKTLKAVDWISDGIRINGIRYKCCYVGQNQFIMVSSQEMNPNVMIWRILLDDYRLNFKIVKEITPNDPIYSYVCRRGQFITPIHNMFAFKNKIIFLENYPSNCRQEISNHVYDKIACFDTNTYDLTLMQTKLDESSQTYPVIRQGMSAVVHENKLIVAGGYVRTRRRIHINKGLADIWSLDCFSMEWKLWPMTLAKPVNRACSIVTQEGCFFLYGGEEILKYNRFYTNDLQYLWLAPKTLKRIAIETILRQKPSLAERIEDLSNPLEIMQRLMKL